MSEADGHPVVPTLFGRVEGRSEGGPLAFLGLPYARPPVGPRRFRPPEPPEPWTGVRPASRRGPVAPQLRLGKDPSELVDGDEDCLYLDVRTPGLAPGRHPVVVWLHGGAFQWGNSDVVAYLERTQAGAERLAQRGIVVVSVTYRLGALGWLALDHLDPSHAGSANNGLLDQLAALDWVRDNIERFGGDPNRVTIAGQSAGAIAAATMLAGPGLGKFHQAVLMSGAASSTRTIEQASALTAAVLDALGVDTLRELRSVPVDDLLRAQFAVTRPGTVEVCRPEDLLAFGPVVDGMVVADEPLAAIRRGAGCDVPVMIGTNQDEFRNVALRRENRGLDREHLVMALGGRAHERLVDAYIDRLDGDDIGDVWDAIRSDAVFRIPAIDLADARSTFRATTYRYFYSRHAGAGSASHGVQVGLFWGLYDAPRWGYLSRTMSDYFASFIKSGKPTASDDSPPWPSFGAQRSTMVFGNPNTVADDPDATIRQLWRETTEATTT